MDQLKARKALLEEQKELKREMFNEAKKEYENYLKEEKRQLENQVKYKCQFRKDLNDQIKANKEIHVSVQYYKFITISNVSRGQCIIQVTFIFNF